MNIIKLYRWLWPLLNSITTHLFHTLHIIHRFLICHYSHGWYRILRHINLLHSNREKVVMKYIFTIFASVLSLSEKNWSITRILVTYTEKQKELHTTLKLLILNAAKRYLPSYFDEIIKIKELKRANLIKILFFLKGWS